MTQQEALNLVYDICHTDDFDPNLHWPDDQFETYCIDMFFTPPSAIVSAAEEERLVGIAISLGTRILY